MVGYSHKLQTLALCCFNMSASTRAFYTADDVVSMFERDGFCCLDTSESSSTGDEVLDLTDILRLLNFVIMLLSCT